MKHFTLLLLLLPFLNFAQVTTTVNFDYDSLWTAGLTPTGGAATLTGYGSHSYNVAPNFAMTSENIFKENTAVQDGSAGLLGTAAIRIRHAAGSFAQFKIATGGVSTFSLKARRWDNFPDGNFKMDWSNDNGLTWTHLQDFNNIAFGDSSAFGTYTYTLNDNSPNILIKVYQNGTGAASTLERMMIDDFSWTSMAVVNPCSTTAPTAANASVCAGGDVTVTATAASNGTLNWYSAATNGTLLSTGATFTMNGATTSQSVFVVEEFANCPASDATEVVITVNALPTATVTYNEGVLTAATATTYQWINCADNSEIAGATAATYAPINNGSYAVIVTNADACADTSACFAVTDLSIATKETLNVTIAPNPTTGKFTISAKEAGKFNVVVYNALGQVVYTANQVANGTVVNLENNMNGVYMIQLASDGKTSVYRIVKN